VLYLFSLCLEIQTELFHDDPFVNNSSRKVSEPVPTVRQKEYIESRRGAEIRINNCGHVGTLCLAIAAESIIACGCMFH
jgi:hypothetical protein